MALNNVNIYETTGTAINDTSPAHFHYTVPNNSQGLPVRPNSKIEIRLSCKNLPNYDVLSKSDSRIFVYFEEKVFKNGVYTSTWKNIGCTETIKNNLNPKFTKSFIMDYYFQYVWGE